MMDHSPVHLKKGAHHRPRRACRRLLIPIILSPSLLLLFLSRHLLSHIEDSQNNNNYPLSLTPQQLQQLNDTSLANHLATSLHFWLSGSPSNTLLQIASVCDRNIVIDAILINLHSIHKKNNILNINNSSVGIVDVGAANGMPLSSYLFKDDDNIKQQKNVSKWYLPIEPHPILFQTLKNNLLSTSNQTDIDIFPLQAAISNESTTNGYIYIHDQHPQLSCINCQSQLDINTTTKTNVSFHTLDDLLLNNTLKSISSSILTNQSFNIHSKQLNIHLLHSNTHGHDTFVLNGATSLFKKQLIQHVLVPFDLDLLPSKSQAIDMIMTAISGGMRCLQLAYINKHNHQVEQLHPDHLPKSFSKQIWNLKSAHEFYHHVEKSNFPTELLCVKRS